MKRVILIIFLVFSLITMVALTVSINQMMQSIGTTWTNLLDYFNSNENRSFSEIVTLVGLLLRIIFEAYGTPLIVFLICLNGLKKREWKMQFFRD